jgi:hypothetical protein
MPHQERAFVRQTALLWPATGQYDRYGEPIVALSPSEIKVRWIDTKMEVLDPQGNTITIDAQAIVLIDVPINSHMWLGTLKDWIDNGSAAFDQPLMEVKMFNATPDIKNRIAFRTLGMMRLHNKGAN